MEDFNDHPSAGATREMTVPADAVWTVLSDLGSLAEWAPGIDRATVTSGAGTNVGAVREVTTTQFGVIEHHVTEWAEGSGFSYVTADSGPFARTLTRYDVTALEPGSSKVSVTLVFEVKPGAMPVEQAQAVLSKGLEATLQALELRARATLAA